MEGEAWTISHVIHAVTMSRQICNTHISLCLSSPAFNCMCNEHGGERRPGNEAIISNVRGGYVHV